MLLPVNSPLADPRSICHAIHGTDDGDAPSVSDPVQLFSDDYDANNGNIMTLSPSRRKWVLSRIVDEMSKGMEEINNDDDEVFGLPAWQEYTCSVTINLGL